LVASKTGRDGSFAIHQEADFWIGRFAKGGHATHQLKAGRHAWVHVAKGDILIGSIPLSSGDGAAISEGMPLEFLAQNDSQILLFDLN
jgi:redox-sensitive bicupin YhaK (pirin superfamily)